MKKILSVLVMLAVIFSMTACSRGNANATNDTVPSEQPSVENEVPDNADVSSDAAQNETPEPSDAEAEAEQGSNILVAYFSRVGNTDWESGVDAVTSASLNVIDGEFFGNAQLLAQMAQEATGGDLFLIQTEETYPSGYRDTTDAAKAEQNANARPALASHVENMDQYDTIVLIYPNWWGTIPMPLYTFLEEYDFSGKTILPLCTHEGSAMGSSARTIADLCPNATLLDGLSVRGSNAASAQSDVESWINKSGILQ